MICCTYFSTSTFAVNWIFHDSILPCKRMLESPALVNEAFDVKFCICVGGNFRTFIFFGKHASIFMVLWRFSVGFTALVWECFLRIGPSEIFRKQLLMQMWHGKCGFSFRKIDGYRSLDGLRLNMSHQNTENLPLGISKFGGSRF